MGRPLAAAQRSQRIIDGMSRATQILENEGLWPLLRAGMRRVLLQVGLRSPGLTLEKALTVLEIPISPAVPGILLFFQSIGSLVTNESHIQYFKKRGWEIRIFPPSDLQMIISGSSPWGDLLPGATLCLVEDEAWLPYLLTPVNPVGWKVVWIGDSLPLEKIEQVVIYKDYGEWDPIILKLYPLVSILILTYNNLPITQLCLKSILENTVYPSYELIIVDNASQDGTPQFLLTSAQTHSNIHFIKNEENRGFAAGNNQALNAAHGEYIIFLNNDTVIPPGWLTTLLGHLEPTGVGMVGPRTNSWGNESRLEVNYQSLEMLYQFAMQRQKAFAGQSFELPMLALFCLGMRKEVVDKIGYLDERFGLGMFEDDDYSHRVRKGGYTVLCAQDVFIHHWGRQSFSKLEKGAYDRLFDENKKKYEEKWGIRWEKPRLDI